MAVFQKSTLEAASVFVFADNPVPAGRIPRLKRLTATNHKEKPEH
jgi:hypothetical protein